MRPSLRAMAKSSSKRPLPPRLKPYIIGCAAVQLTLFALFEHARGRFFVDRVDWPAAEVNLVNGAWAGATVFAYGWATADPSGGRLRRLFGAFGRYVGLPLVAALFCGMLSDLGVPYAVHGLLSHPVQLADEVSGKVIVRHSRVPDSPELHGRLLDERYGLGLYVPWATYDAASIGQPMILIGRESPVGLWVDGKDLRLEPPHEVAQR